METVTVRREATNGIALVSYELATRILTSAISSSDDQPLGGMWSVAATLFVWRECYSESVSAALSRTAATALSFILCLGFLLLYPFSSWGMAILIAIGAVILMIIDRPRDLITASITTAVVMVVAGISSQHALSQRSCDNSTLSLASPSALRLRGLPGVFTT
ncbi:MAG: FUSC family protein [Terriglobales bacterium]